VRQRKLAKRLASLERLAAKLIGSYRYFTRLQKGKETECLVKVFPMRVDECIWPEAEQRRRVWPELPQAALRVDDTEQL
jgi:hypothetical protein